MFAAHCAVILGVIVKCWAITICAGRGSFPIVQNRIAPGLKCSRIEALTPTNRMKTKTYTAAVFIAGDLSKIKDVCRRFCLSGLCVTITQTDYVFTGGSESGAVIGLINYPRFPSTPAKIKQTAIRLARQLMKECCQRSCSVVCSDTTEYLKNPVISIPR